MKAELKFEIIKFVDNPLLRGRDIYIRTLRSLIWLLKTLLFCLVIMGHWENVTLNRIGGCCLLAPPWGVYFQKREITERKKWSLERDGLNLAIRGHLESELLLLCESRDLDNNNNSIAHTRIFNSSWISCDFHTM